MNHQQTELLKASTLAVRAAEILEQLSSDPPNEYFALRNALFDVRNNLDHCHMKLKTLFKDMDVFGKDW